MSGTGADISQVHWKQQWLENGTLFFHVSMSSSEQLAQATQPTVREPSQDLDEHVHLLHLSVMRTFPGVSVVTMVTVTGGDWAFREQTEQSREGLRKREIIGCGEVNMDQEAHATIAVHVGASVWHIRVILTEPRIISAFPTASPVIMHVFKISEAPRAKWLMSLSPGFLPFSLPLSSISKRAEPRRQCRTSSERRPAWLEFLSDGQKACWMNHFARGPQPLFWRASGAGGRDSVCLLCRWREHGEWRQGDVEALRGGSVRTVSSFCADSAALAGSSRQLGFRRAPHNSPSTGTRAEQGDWHTCPPSPGMAEWIRQDEEHRLWINKASSERSWRSNVFPQSSFTGCSRAMSAREEQATGAAVKQGCPWQR
ncbi:hypothetical protein P4O66_002790 [Electrophorus voltai]|uniref:Astrotactin-1/2 N-terminal domain-containing protein n=1 Tax=Electrophorus voltai TaxID=2609070 RepID=A0AAD9DNW8_9TELE|nr:hypothetical protein P4O66_002790 [Electrophorus voltai]